MMYPQTFTNAQGNYGGHNGFPYGATSNNMIAGNGRPFYNLQTVAPPLANYGSVYDPAWYIDYGATNHVAQDAGILSYYSLYCGAERLYIGNGMGLPIHGIRTVIVTTSSTTLLYLHNVLHVPIITKNILSVPKLLADNNVLIEFHTDVYFVKAKNSRIILLKGTARGGLYQVKDFKAVCHDFKLPSSVSSFSKSFSNLIKGQVSMFTQLSSSCVVGSSQSHVNNLQVNKNVLVALSVSFNKSIDYNLLHKRMGHPTIHALKQVIKCLNPTFKIDITIQPKFCYACQFGKCHMQHFHYVETSTTRPLELFHADL